VGAGGSRSSGGDLTHGLCRASFAHPPEEIVLDSVHGDQEGRFFYRCCDGYCFLPLHVFCGQPAPFVPWRYASWCGRLRASAPMTRDLADALVRAPRCRHHPQLGARPDPAKSARIQPEPPYNVIPEDKQPARYHSFRKPRRKNTKSHQTRTLHEISGLTGTARNWPRSVKLAHDICMVLDIR